MPDTPEPPKPPAPDRRAERERRLAAALRENLRRRKQQFRTRTEPPPEAPAKPRP